MRGGCQAVNAVGVLGWWVCWSACLEFSLCGVGVISGQEGVRRRSWGGLGRQGRWGALWWSRHEGKMEEATGRVHCRQQGTLLTVRPRGLLLPLSSVAAQVDGDVDSEEEEEEGMGDIDVEKVATLEV